MSRPTPIPPRPRPPRFRRRTVIVAIAAFAAIWTLGAGVVLFATRSDEAALVVAGETVDRGLLDEMVDATMDSMRDAPRVAMPAEDQRQSIQDMMAVQLSTLALLRREARERGISVTDNDLRRAASGTPDPESVDLTDGQMRVALEFSVLRTKFRQVLLQDNPPDLSQRAVAAWYAKNKDQFHTPRRRGAFALEATSRAKAQAALDDVRANEPLGNLFKKHGDPTSQTYASGGTFMIQDGSLAPALVERLMAAPTRTWVGPVRAGSRWMIVYLSEPAEAASTLALADSKATIKEAISNRHADAMWEDFIAQLRRKYAGETKDPEGLLPAEISAQPGAAGPAAPIRRGDEVPPAAPSPKAPKAPASASGPAELIPPAP